MPFESRTEIYWIVDVLNTEGRTVFRRKENDESKAKELFDRDWPVGFTITLRTVREYVCVEVEFVRSLTFANDIVPIL